MATLQAGAVSVEVVNAGNALGHWPATVFEQSTIGTSSAQVECTAAPLAEPVAEEPFVAAEDWGSSVAFVAFEDGDSSSSSVHPCNATKQ
mmetsp:Transcript_122771/g.223335  ORF Transcript_122771/g.223335 Transcript_122771/m.223335 type:complete len:90 (+) Transcript_122771:1895-2164(+)